MANQERIKVQIEKLLDLLGVQGTVAIEDRTGQLVFNIRTPESRMLIGQHGAHLKALQHLSRLLVRRGEGVTEEGAADFYVDVEDYRKNRDEFLVALAHQAAERVRQTGQTLVLKPMASSDRRVIHATLSDLSDLTTESTGEEPERRITIKPRKEQSAE